MTKIIVICVAFIFIIFTVCFCDVKNAVVTGFNLTEIPNQGLEINLQASYCLQNAKLVAIVTPKSAENKSEIIEIPRVYYDMESLEAVFNGILPYKKEEIDLTFKISNYQEPELSIDFKDNQRNDVMMAEMIERQKQEQIFNEREADYKEEFRTSQKKAEEKAQEQEQAAAETLIVVVILLPMLLDSVTNINFD